MSALRLSSDGTGRILDRLKNWSEHYVHTEPFNRTIWLVYGTGTNARGFWLVKQTLGWKIFMPENFLEINRYFALTSCCNTIGQSNNAFSILGFSLTGNEEAMFWSLIQWLIEQITNTYRNHFSKSYETRSTFALFMRKFERLGV